MATSTDSTAHDQDPAVTTNQLLVNITPADKQTIDDCFQRSPQLSLDFNNVINFCQLVERDPHNYEALFESLGHVRKAFRYRFEDVQQISRLAAAAGFAEQAAKVYRQVMGGMDRLYLAGLLRPHPDHKTGCVAALSGMLLNFTDKGADFRLKLARTGLLKDMADTLRALQHLSDQALSNDWLVFHSLGTIHNCCKHPDVVPIVRELHITSSISPFLRTKLNTIRGAALLLLAFVAEGDDVHLMELDHTMLQYFLCRAEAAWASHNRGKNGWETEEVLVGLSHFSTLPFNRRLIVAKGVVTLLCSVLQAGMDDEREAAAATLAQLAMDPDNVKLFQRDRVLRDALDDVDKSDCSKRLLSITASVVSKIKQPSNENNLPEHPAVSEVLAEQRNVLDILCVGHVQFLMDQLVLPSSPGVSSPSDVMSRVSLLRALGELAADDSCRREILARGGLDHLQRWLNTCTEKQKAESASLLLKLATCKEYCILIQAHKDVMETVTGLVQQGTEGISSVARQILDTIARHVKVIK